MKKPKRRIRDRRQAATRLFVEQLEDRTVPASLSGYVYSDLNANGIFDDVDVGIPNVAVGLGVVTTYQDYGNGYTAIALTGADGSYRFDVPDGPNSVFTLSEGQPEGYTNGTNAVGTAGVAAGTLVGDGFDGIRVSPGQNATGYNFGEKAKPATLSGIIYEDINLNGVYDAGDKGLAGAGYSLSTATTYPNGTGKGYTADGITGPDGTFTFQVGDPEFTVVSLSTGQPEGYIDGTNAVGTAGGTLNGDTVSNIRLAPGQNATGYTFGNRAQNAVYVGTVINVSPTITNTNNNQNVNSNSVSNSNTNNNGNTQAQTQSQSQSQSESQGSSGTNNNSNTNHNDDSCPTPPAPLPPAPVPPPTPAVATLSGTVYLDENKNLVFDDGEAGLKDVTLVATQTADLAGNPVAGATPHTTTAGADGTYLFTDLPPGVYKLEEEKPQLAVETDTVPIVGVVDTPHYPGDGGIDGAASGDAIAGIKLISGAIGFGYDFAEVPLPPSPTASLDGFVFADLNRNGNFDSGESGVPGATIVATQTADNAGTPIAGGPEFATKTYSDGSWILTGLPAGVYQVEERKPEGQVGTDTVPIVGVVDTPHFPGDGGIDGAVSGGAVLGIKLTSGANGFGYNFAEIPVAPPPVATVAAQIDDALQNTTPPVLVPVAEKGPMPKPYYFTEPAYRGGVFMTAGDFDDLGRVDHIVKHPKRHHSGQQRQETQSQHQSQSQHQYQEQR